MHKPVMHALIPYKVSSVSCAMKVFALSGCKALMH